MASNWNSLMALLVVCNALSSVCPSFDGGGPELEPLANIPQLGMIRGRTMASASGNRFLAFRGVPYATPPLGELRFKEPLPVQPWPDTFDASQEGPTCIQYESNFQTVIGVEDCLTLNVYTPGAERTDNLKPVMVFIHGGAWFEGSGNGETGIYGPAYFMDRNVVLVTINYRLEILGFLSTGDEHAPGNYGLLDQSLALKWVSEFIEHFGGDPESVTLFGESAGGASVEFHMLSPYSKGLFHKAIAQSGSSNCDWAIRDSEILEYTKQVSSFLGCPYASSQELLTCLRSKPAEEIVAFRKSIVTLSIYPLTFAPRIDRERALPFLPASPQELIENGRFHSVPFISGLNRNEGAFAVASLLSKDRRDFNAFVANPIEYLQFLLGIELREDRTSLAKRVIDNYFAPDKDYDTQLHHLEKMVSDSWFFKCVDESVKRFSKHSSDPVYYYQYAHKSDLSLSLILGVSADLGVGHADELFMMFSNSFFHPLSSPNDLNVSNMLLDLWTSFATNGKPVSSPLSEDWIPMAGDQTRYLRIDSEKATMVNGLMPFNGRMVFWDQLYGRTVRRDEL